MTLLLTKPFTDEIVVRDDADRWALMQERALRELRWRRETAGAAAVVDVPLAEIVPESAVLAVGERRVGDAIVYSAAFLDTTGPEAV